MGYQIYYGQAGDHRQHKIISDQKKAKKKRIFLIVGLLLMGAFALCVIPQMRVNLAQWLLPGDASVTANALEEMIVALKDGQSIQTALTDFCREIMDHGLQAA